MHPLRTAILEHATPTGIHHDWLIEDPRLPNPKAPTARLWTARVTPPPQDWPKLKGFDLTVIPPHRRIYLDYQGPVSGNRGNVRRLAAGMCHVSLWSAERIVIHLQCESVELDLQLQRYSDEGWTARSDQTAHY